MTRETTTGGSVRERASAASARVRDAGASVADRVKWLIALARTRGGDDAWLRRGWEKCDDARDGMRVGELDRGGGG